MVSPTLKGVCTDMMRELFCCLSLPFWKKTSIFAFGSAGFDNHINGIEQEIQT
jgi:hypothetical protein